MKNADKQKFHLFVCYDLKEVSNMHDFGGITQSIRSLELIGALQNVSLGEK